MRYVGTEGVVACYYAIVKTCLPEIAFAKAFEEDISLIDRLDHMQFVIKHFGDLPIKEQGELCGMNRNTFSEYKTRHFTNGKIKKGVRK